MKEPDTTNRGDSPASADAQSKESGHLVVFAGIAAALTLAFALLAPGGDVIWSWVLVGLALISVACAFAAIAKAKKKTGGGQGVFRIVTLCASVGLLIYGVMGILAIKDREQSFDHNVNEQTLSSLSEMLATRYQKTNEYPAALSDMEEEATLFVEATIDDFLKFTDPQTDEKKAWTYERISASECTVKSDPYRYKGEKIVLVLKGKDGALERADE